MNIDHLIPFVAAAFDTDLDFPEYYKKYDGVYACGNSKIWLSWVIRRDMSACDFRWYNSPTTVCSLGRSTEFSSYMPKKEQMLAGIFCLSEEPAFPFKFDFDQFASFYRIDFTAHEKTETLAQYRSRLEALIELTTLRFIAPPVVLLF